jgi:hypothetical protein
MSFDEEKFERDMEKTGHILAIREAFLKMEGEFTSMDIYRFINKNELAEKVPIDNIVDALERFQEKGELKVVNDTPPKKYRRTINPT